MKQDNEHRPAYLRLYERLRGEIVRGAESEGSAISNTMIWLENNALWAGLVVIAAAVGIMVIWKKHRED